ncbi:nucleotidyl transferase AbiEii/AbiGii toxin family protein [Arabiibacter massiliensis]|uniref:nucleotidyl transferase AbiEii/AbiGii toxin family protein n=1 Tax=Arabiibacter massiliensis TaxID=1870985 RepID=UPI0009BBE5C5|nr:nucleotidyl transferase AbiEii/AbiGii toxin family protein [Arabiibacter massiliensis]
MGDTDDVGAGGTRANLSELLGALKPKSKEPRSVRVLDSWIAHAENEFGIGQGGRLAWLVASTVATAKLQQVISATGDRFSLKGGTLLQHRLGLDARATKDLDGIVQGELEEFLRDLDAELKIPWGPVAFYRTPAEVIRVSTRVVKPLRFEMILSLHGDVWRRVKVEISPDEGRAASSQELLGAPNLAGFGLPTPDFLVGMALSYQIAQKVHACTDPHDPPAFRNERPRDVVDLVLLKRLAEATGSPSNLDVRSAILDIFSSRAKEARILNKPIRTWPVRVIAYSHWNADYASAAATSRLDLSMEDAVGEVNRWLEDIDNLS